MDCFYFLAPPEVHTPFEWHKRNEVKKKTPLKGVWPKDNPDDSSSIRFCWDLGCDDTENGDVDTARLLTLQ